MADVTITDARFSLASDLTDTVTLPMSALSITAPKVGTFRRYANGRQRLVTQAGQHDTLAMEFTYAPKADIETLERFTGQTVLFRDFNGRKVYGAVLSVTMTEIPGTDGSILNGSCSFTELTFSEEV